MNLQLTNKRIVIAGGSGFLGLSMANSFAGEGAEVTILSRSVLRAAGSWTHRFWDGRTLGDWAAAIDGCDAVVNLAGRTVNCIKTPDHCDEIVRSRVESTRVLGEAMRAVNSPPPVWVQMSTAHIYGDPPSAVCTESSAEGVGLAPTVARAWEAAFAWMVRIGAPLFVRTDPELVLYGRYVIPKRLMDEGFQFQFPELEPALRDLHEGKN